MNNKHAIAVFCGSTFGNNPIYIEKTKELASIFYDYSINLVYGGGNRGLMGVLAHSVSDYGLEVTGVLPKAMNFGKVTDGSAKMKTIITDDMHERKRVMYSLSDGFIALPGGIGTMEELCEIYTWRQLGYTNSNVGIYNINGFYDDFLKQLDKEVDEGFINKEVRDSLIVSDNPNLLIKRILEEKKELPSKL